MIRLARTIGDLFAIRHGTRLPAAKSGNSVAVRVVTPAHVSNDLQLLSAELTEETGSPSLRGAWLTPGDVVVTARTTPVRAAVAGTEHEGTWAGPNLLVLTPRDGRMPSAVLAAYLRHPQVSEHLLRNSRGRPIAGINASDLRTLEIALPGRDVLQRLERLARAADEVTRRARAMLESNAAIVEAAIAEALGERG